MGDEAQGLWGGDPMPESREVMNVHEVVKYLGVSRDTLYRYLSQHRIPAFKLGNRWKFKKTLLDRWMEREIRQSGKECSG